jgi:alpha-beta hydrolase superfamily lysophospholipase
MRVPARLEIDVTGAAPAGVTTVVADLFAPDPRRLAWPAIVLWCLPGGGMSRRYFDLDVDPEHGNYSMARHLAGRGFVVVTIDHAGIGESSRPHDGYSLTPHVLADVNASAMRVVTEGLRTGTVTEGLPPLARFTSIGVGHSAGAGITVHQQARHRTHAALALLGYHGRGLPSHLNDDERSYAGDPDGVRRDLALLVRARFGDPLPMMARGSSRLLVAAPMPEPVHSALVAARTNLLALAGLSSMIPGSATPELGAVDVPVFLGLGSLDLTDDIHGVPAQFPASSDVSLFVLEGSGHNHNVAANREQLWDRLARWARSIPLPA